MIKLVLNPGPPKANVHIQNILLFPIKVKTLCRAPVICLSSPSGFSINSAQLPLGAQDFLNFHCPSV